MSEHGKAPERGMELLHEAEEALRRAAFCGRDYGVAAANALGNAAIYRIDLERKERRRAWWRRVFQLQEGA